MIVFAINGRVPAVEQRLQQELAAGTTLLIPTIVLFELRYGIAKSGRREASAQEYSTPSLRKGFEALLFDAEDALAEAGDIRAALETPPACPIGAYDVLIAAQARAAAARFSSRAIVARSSRIPGLMVTDWADVIFQRFSHQIERLSTAANATQAR